MATTVTIVPVREYLSEVYRPDCDYVDGEVRERNMGEHDHARLQALIASWFLGHEAEWKIESLIEQRVRAGEARYRIPDVCLLHADAPYEKIIEHPPLLCIEILSPEDRLTRVVERIEDFLRMGVEHVWLIDPTQRKSFVCKPGSMTEPQDGQLKIAGTPIFLDMNSMFSLLDKKRD